MIMQINKINSVYPGEGRRRGKTCAVDLRGGSASHCVELRRVKLRNKGETSGVDTTGTTPENRKALSFK